VTDRVRTLERERTVAEALGQGRAAGRDVVAIANEHDADLHLSRLVIVRDGRVELSNGMELAYDDLVVATGARVVSALPGATTLRGLEDVAEIRAIRHQLLARDIHSVAFAVPAKSTWALPLYNLALAMGAEAAAAGVTDAQLTIVTPHDAPLPLFGSAAGDALAPLLAASGVVLRTGVQPVQVQDGRLLLGIGQALPAERVIALGAGRGRPPVGLTPDRGGFLAVDDHGAVRGCQDVFAAGDVTAHLPKHGGLAAQQADAVAQAIAARLGVAIEPQPYRPSLRGLRIGDAPLDLRAGYADSGIENVNMRRGWMRAKVPPSRIVSHASP
jgi:sulfide:quinone oxidoreductase